ncbi:MAG: hypothetical protein IJP94_04035 [Clostridia bacterium]|nr:hypothetical protein [Clostridia bacterium]MBQ3470992.1 hypothetical protein [Clostridia bacterium]MBQ6530600.1 hypothetical protein [Clostridia bacterium]MBR0088994.1 hypothetical protein [Clostridia bacterium]
MKREKHLGLVISNELHYKLKYIAEYDGRSLNGQVIYLINKCIREFEKENGTIEEQE